MENELMVKSKADSAIVAAETGRAVTEVMGQVEMAKKFPRDMDLATNRLKASCRNKKLALDGVYLFPRGGKLVSDISIRLAEVLAQNWGNIDMGITELENRGGESVMMAYAWDLETNTRVKKTFSVKHERKAYGKVVKLTDPRDVYELTANLGSRRLRACILQIIPSWYKEEAKEACDKSMYNSDEKIEDRMPKMVKSFDKYGVSEAMLEKRVGKASVEMEIEDFVVLTRIFLAIKDGMAKPSDYFDMSVKQSSDMKNQLTKADTKKDKKPKKDDLSAVEKLKLVLASEKMTTIIENVKFANSWESMDTEDEATAQLYLDEITEADKV